MDRRAVTAAVLMVGPATVRGPNLVSDEIICEAINSIDDEYALVDERPVDVDELWASVIAETAGHSARGLLLVCPGWWSDARVRRIQRAAAEHRAEPTVLRRHEAYRAPAGCTIEIAPEFVLCRIAGSPVAVTPRLGEVTGVAEAVAHSIAVGGPALIDAPMGVAGAADLAAAIAAHLRGRGRDIQIVDDATLAADVAEDAADLADDMERAAAVSPRHRRTGWALPVGALMTIGALLGAAWMDEPAGEPTMLITEGRVTVQIPAEWAVRRITTGAGSRRIQAYSSDEEASAILLTQSPAGPDLAAAAAVLKAALDLQPPGVFREFRDDDHRGGRAVVSYIELRDDREITWAVFLDGRSRIAIGCQQPTSVAETIRRYCDEAIRSAHASP